MIKFKLYFLQENILKAFCPQKAKIVVVVYSLSCIWLCDTMHYSLPGFSVHGISQARILVWVAISFSAGASRPRDQTHVSCKGRHLLHHWATSEANYNITVKHKESLTITWNNRLEKWSELKWVKLSWILSFQWWKTKQD